LFFVLSGFLITDILLRMKETLPVKAYFVKFYGRRFLRIFPLYYFYLVFMVIVTSIFLAHNYRPGYMQLFLDQVKYAFLYVYNFFNASAGWEESKFIGHFWSLSVEEQFYIFWPLVIFLSPKKYLKNLFLAAIAIGPISRFALAVLFNRHAFDFLYSNTLIGIYVLPFSHLDAFGLGAYLTRFELPRPKLQLAVLTILIPVIGIASQYLIAGDMGDVSALGYAFPLGNGLKHVWGYLLLNYYFAVLIYCVVREKLFVRILEWPFLSYLGKISYGLYVYHYAITWFAGRIRDTGMPESQVKPLLAITAFIATLALAAASYRFYEKPVLDLKEKYFSLRPAKTENNA
jgi:peptidoglycan/LPS O-acetylase OafA/YrhL